MADEKEVEEIPDEKAAEIIRLVEEHAADVKRMCSEIGRKLDAALEKINKVEARQ